MQPVLFSVGSFPVSSFGVFLLLSFFAAIFSIWRVVKLYDLDEEQVIDLIILTTTGGLLGARLFYVALNLNQFQDPLNILLINIYPGLNFWGTLFGGFLLFRLFAYRFKINFYQLADYAIVGLFLGLSISSLGCLLGSCQVGQVSNLPIAVDQVGLLGKRFPLQIVESLIFLLGFLSLWRGSLRFHQAGSILGKGLILLGLYKFILEFFRGDNLYLFSWITLGHIFSILVFIFGLRIIYREAGSFKRDLRQIVWFFTDSNKRKQGVSRFYKNCYNYSTNFKISFRKGIRKVLRLINVKSNPTKF